MRPRNLARPAAAGALCMAITAAGAQTALAQTETSIGVHHRKLQVRSGNSTAVSGRVAPGVTGITVSLQVKRGRHWKPIDRDRTDAGGGYELRERLRRTGSTKARVRVAGGPGVAPEKRVIGRLNVYRAAYASWYGPGLYGNPLACGGTLGAGTLGVAHKTLPCGTRVTLKRGKRTVRVPVVDRGPFVGGREYDLTAATAQRLGFHGHGTVLTTR
jgi:peptidoglycan lytic transglycosylase